jgi:hypothetical protein
MFAHWKWTLRSRVSGDQDDKSPVNREVHAGICGSRGVRVPRPPDQGTWERRWGASDPITSGQGSQSLLRAAAIKSLIIQSTDGRVAVGPYPGFRVSFRFRLVGMRGVAASDHEGEPCPHWPWTLWLNTFTSLAVGLECGFLIFMVGQRLVALARITSDRSLDRRTAVRCQSAQR